MDKSAIVERYANTIKQWQDFFEMSLFGCDTYGMGKADGHICEKLRDFCAEVGITMGAWDTEQALYAITGGENCELVLAKLAKGRF